MYIHISLLFVGSLVLVGLTSLTEKVNWWNEDVFETRTTGIGDEYVRVLVCDSVCTLSIDNDEVSVGNRNIEEYILLLGVENIDESRGLMGSIESKWIVINLLV